jgi:hypothetical protein
MKYIYITSKRYSLNLIFSLVVALRNRENILKIRLFDETYFKSTLTNKCYLYIPLTIDNLKHEMSQIHVHVVDDDDASVANDDVDDDG